MIGKTTLITLLAALAITATFAQTPLSDCQHIGLNLDGAGYVHSLVIEEQQNTSQLRAQVLGSLMSTHRLYPVAFQARVGADVMVLTQVTTSWTYVAYVARDSAHVCLFEVDKWKNQN